LSSQLTQDSLDRDEVREKICSIYPVYFLENWLASYLSLALYLFLVTLIIIIKFGFVICISIPPPPKTHTQQQQPLPAITKYTSVRTHKRKGYIEHSLFS